MTLRVQSSLSDTVEEVASQIVGVCLDVHRELGPGMLEGVYHRALAIEFDARGISYANQVAVPIWFKGQVLCHHRLDLIVDEQVVVELKSVERLTPLHLAQAISYLRATRLRLALLLNFNVPIMRQGIRRVVL